MRAVVQRVSQASVSVEGRVVSQIGPGLLVLLGVARGGGGVVSQLTRRGEARRGRRPSYGEAAPPEEASRLYGRFVAKVQESGLRVEEGVFRAMMEVALVNQGPATILL